MLNRRDAIRATLQTSTLLALAPNVPGFLARTARAAQATLDGKVLVVVQLDGGNDGINTVVPLGDDAYARARPNLRIDPGRVLKIDARAGLHPSMTAAAKLLESGRLAIVPGVGYPNPNRSHFESMAIWQSARLDPEDRDGPGWLGRGLDQARGGPGEGLFVGEGAVPVALRGRRSVATSLDRPEDLVLDSPAASGLNSPRPGDDLAAFVERATLDAYAASDQIAALTRAPARGRSSGPEYPASDLGGRLRTIAGLLKAGHRARIFYTTQTGYDTHSDQLVNHGRLLGDLSSSLQAFLDDLAASGLGERVVVLGFSEFGRRVAENGSRGTDHGTSGPVFLAGDAVKPGLAGPLPRLDDLEGGDLKTLVDFRRVYATVLEGWLDMPSSTTLAGRFEPLPILRS